MIRFIRIRWFSSLFGAVYIALPVISRQTDAKLATQRILGGMSRYKLSKTVVMVGMMGAGKTAIGLALAKLIGVRFQDSDAQIEKAANLTIAEIFENFGEDFFRDKEGMVLARLLEGDPVILSTGGGAYLQTANRDSIGNKGLAVWLKADRDLLWSRVRNKTTRPLLQVENPRERLFELLDERTPFYQKAGLVVEARSDYSIQDMAERVLDGLLSHPSQCLKKVG
ncbi:MAG: shikimate kinase [Paracoccaceae bacterium]